MCASMLLINNGHMGLCWVGAKQSLKLGCVLVGCQTGMETGLRAGFSNGDMSVR